MKRIFLSIFVIIAGCIANHAQNNTARRVDDDLYYSPTPGRITLVAYTPISEGSEPTKAMYNDIVECGFNAVTSVGSYQYFKQQFSLIDDLPLKYIISMRYILGDNEEKYVKDLSKDRHFGGWLLKDEPTYEFLPELKEQYSRLRKIAGNDLIIINLVGVMEKAFTADFKSFSNYLDYIQSQFRPQLWDYDYYPVIKKNGKLKIMYDEFYTALQNFYTISKKTKRPFWAFCESMEYKTGWYSRPAANEAYLGFEAFSALAYGAQGIQYWTYGMRKTYSTETYLSALVDWKGKKTSAWYAAQKVNKEIIKFNDVFYGCDVSEVKHTGKTHYEGTTQLKGKFGPFESVITEDVGALFSRLSSNGKEYVVIVNHDVNKVQKIKLTLAPNQKVKRLTDNKKATQTGNTLQFQLEKGGWAIFEIEDSV